MDRGLGRRQKIAPGLIGLPITNSLKSLHDEPRYKAIYAAIDFP